jgi:hypothetical protein
MCWQLRMLRRFHALFRLAKKQILALQLLHQKDVLFPTSLTQIPDDRKRRQKDERFQIRLV